MQDPLLKKNKINNTNIDIRINVFLSTSLIFSINTIKNETTEIAGNILGNTCSHEMALAHIKNAKLTFVATSFILQISSIMALVTHDISNLFFR